MIELQFTRKDIPISREVSKKDVTKVITDLHRENIIPTIVLHSSELTENIALFNNEDIAIIKLNDQPIIASYKEWCEIR